MGCCTFTKSETQPARIGEKRSCTDVFWLFTFLCGWVMMGYILLEAIKNGGDPNKIVRAVDMYGRICGVDEGVEDKPYGAWPYPLLYDPKICVSSCAETNNASNTEMAWLHRSELFVFYCVPNLVPEGDVSVTVDVSGDFYENFESVVNTVSRSVGDLYIVWPYILLSGVVALVVTFFFTFLLRFLAGIVVWLSILFLGGGGFLLGYSLLELSKMQEGEYGEERAQALKYSAYAAFAVAIIFLLVVFFLRITIQTAVELVKEASRAIGDMKTVIFFPVVPFLGVVAYFAVWTVAGLHIFSVSELETVPTPAEVTTYGYGFEDTPLYGTPNANPTTMEEFVMQEDARAMAGALIFHMLWNVQFLAYFCFLVVAGSVANWYFTYRDHMGNKIRGDGYNELPASPVYKAFKRTIRYHLGTVAISSLLIAIIKFARMCVKYIEDKATPKRGVPSGPQKCVLKTIGCCLKCVECCMDKISKNALIWTAIWGDGFLTSACSSFDLIWRHLRKVAALNAVSHSLMFMGKITIAFVTTGVCAYGLTVGSPHPSIETPQISTPVAPAIVIFMLSYVVAALFMNIFETTIETTLLCFLVDCEHGKDGEMFASRGLIKLIQRHQTESAELASEQYEHAKRYKKGQGRVKRRGGKKGEVQSVPLVERPNRGGQPKGEGEGQQKVLEI
jgi:hypothetical protein